MITYLNSSLNIGVVHPQKELFNKRNNNGSKNAEEENQFI